MEELNPFADEDVGPKLEVFVEEGIEEACESLWVKWQVGGDGNLKY